MDYASHERQFQNRSIGNHFIGLKDPSVVWTDQNDYEKRVRLLYFDCPISRACIEKRAEGVASVKIIVTKGGKSVTDLLNSPNVVDGTQGQFLRVCETELTLGGDLFAFLDQRITGKTQLHVLRQDLMDQDPKSGWTTYNPGRLTNEDRATFRFQMQSGICTAAQERSGRNWVPMRGALIHIKRVNPLSSASGSGDGDAAFRVVSSWIELNNMIHQRMLAGGRKQGYLRLPMSDGPMDDAAEAKLKDDLQKFSRGGGLNTLMDGADFIENQLTFAEMDVVNLLGERTRAIATAFQIPAVFMNLEGESSYAERRAAARIFYKDFVHPRATWLMNQLQFALQRYLDPLVELEIDTTAINYIKEELIEEQTAKQKLGCYTINEIRELAGDPPIAGGDALAGAKSQPSGDEEADQPNSPTDKPREVAFSADSSRRRSER